jgi:hypothetical protein
LIASALGSVAVSKTNSWDARYLSTGVM